MYSICVRSVLADDITNTFDGLNTYRGVSFKRGQNKRGHVSQKMCFYFWEIVTTSPETHEPRVPFWNHSSSVYINCVHEASICGTNKTRCRQSLVWYMYSGTWWGEVTSLHYEALNCLSPPPYWRSSFLKNSICQSVRHIAWMPKVIRKQDSGTGCLKITLE